MSRTVSGMKPLAQPSEPPLLTQPSVPWSWVSWPTPLCFARLKTAIDPVPPTYTLPEPGRMATDDAPASPLPTVQVPPEPSLLTQPLVPLGSCQSEMPELALIRTTAPLFAAAT